MMRLFSISLLSVVSANTWTVDSQSDWEGTLQNQDEVKIEEGLVEATPKQLTIATKLKRYEEKKSPSSITLSQSPIWLNWEPVKNIGPENLGDAPVMLSLGPDNYWMFGKYKPMKVKDPAKVGEEAQLDGFEIPLKTTASSRQFDAEGAEQKPLGGYHAWQSKDMENWVHHGPITDSVSKWMTTAEYVDGKAYLYYDFPNDQDPHLYIDDNLFDGKLGESKGMVFEDPSPGSDCAIIRDLNGVFHLISEDWSPIKASVRAWDSPLASHATSVTGMGDFTLQKPAVDHRTNPTGKFEEYAHPHWHLEDPERFPGRLAEKDVPQHKIKKGARKAYAKYEIHTPEQHAYGDWAAISIGGQYYLFGDYDPAGAHGRHNMKVCWFTSDSIDEKFEFCGALGQGHPDPDVMFAEGKFYLATQMKTDYVSTGPWVESVSVRVGVDEDNDQKIDTWSDWDTVSEKYDYIKDFSKQVAKKAASMDLTSLPDGYGFQVEFRLEDTTENESKPILDAFELSFE